MTDFFADYRRPEWQKFRLELFEYHDFTCQYCGAETKQLHAHHFYYKKGAKPWEYLIEEMRCLCDDCHSKEHMPHAVESCITGERVFEDGKSAILAMCAETGFNYRETVDIIELIKALSLTSSEILYNAMFVAEISIASKKFGGL
jgi:hypothetical protein